MLRKVQVENGWVEGLPAADPRITSFKGIPFAASAGGDNRWRAPQPAKDWDGVRKAYAFGPIAMQTKPGQNKENVYTWEWNPDENIEQSEDCLQLNIWTPAKCGDEKLPVYVWYYGGGLQVGNPAEMEFDGERIARRGVVVVTINYRVNVFGFLCHPEITAESPDAPANFGHLDQQFATRWVKRNIAAFGGDPDNITIGGQSAGGGSVLSQLTSPQNDGLFQKAIIQSGIFQRVYPGGRFPGMRVTLEQAEREGEKFFAFLGVSTLSEARALSAEFVRDKMLEYKAHWGSVIDGTFCVGSPFDLFVENKRLQVPILFGHTVPEFINAPEVDSVESLQQLAKEQFGDDANAFLSLCRSPFDSVTEMKHRASVNGIEYAIRVAGEANARSGAHTPFYYYSFDAEIPGWDDPGAFHSIDLWFFFETLAKCWRPFVGKHYDLARLMCNYWANFIRSGDPNGVDADGSDMPQWDAYTPEAPYGMFFGDTAAFQKRQPSAMMHFLVSQYFKRQTHA